MTDPTRADVLIVGGGSAGSVLARRLSDDPDLRVTLLEAGGDDDDPDIIDPQRWPALLGGRHDWRYRTEPQPGLNGRVLDYPRGKVLGGSSSINASGFQRGDIRLYRGWEQAAGPEWSVERLKACFAASETFAVESEGRGAAGPISVSIPRDGEGHPVALAFISAAQANGAARLADINRPAPMLGVGWGQAAARGNVRMSASWGYLAPHRERENLNIVLGAHADRLIFEGRRCVGLRAIVDGQARTFHADRVILAAGAVGSPLILQRSGIGEASHLAALGVPVRVEAAEVGANLQDHPIARILFAANMRTLRAAAHAPAVLFARSASGSAAAGEGELSDIMMMCGGRMFPDPSSAPAFAVSVALTLPRSRGSVRATSGDPFAAPLIDPAYLADGNDAARMIEGVRMAEALAGMAPLSDWLGPVVNRRQGESAAEFAAGAVAPFFHPTSTCRMGRDEAAVVDPHLRVRGVEALHVADASVMPRIPNAMPNAAILALAENAARILRTQM